MTILANPLLGVLSRESEAIFSGLGAGHPEAYLGAVSIGANFYMAASGITKMGKGFQKLFSGEQGAGKDFLSGAIRLGTVALAAAMLFVGSGAGGAGLLAIAGIAALSLFQLAWAAKDGVSLAAKGLKALAPAV